jgi:chorismate dehydratase
MTALVDMTRPAPASRRRTRSNTRIGAVSYLNSKPLIEGLPELLHGSELVLDYPSRLADELTAGALDVALIPSVEFLRNPSYRIVSDACVATRGPVLSVKLYSRVPLGTIRTLALDEGSRTSAALSRIMLGERYGVEPVLQPLPMGSSCDECTADAMLLIGDRAMLPPREAFVAVWDLGEEWLRWTGLPFVFALWAARPSATLDGVESALCAARDEGVRRIADIARREAPKLGITETLAMQYLTRNLHFHLGSAERSGLKLFSELAAARGLIPAGPRFASVEASGRV